VQRLRESHERLWAGTSSHGLFGQPGTFAFYEHLVEVGLPAGLVHFSVQRLGDRPISWHFGFLGRRVLHWYKPTYEREFEGFSPGKVHLARLVELGVGDGWREIDLGPGTESYKRLWTDDVRPLVQWHWQADSLRGKLYQAGRRAYDLLRKRRAP
jgi:CelD/BcsL family acetyltransferase involved in cellulose biosynthesis